MSSLFRNVSSFWSNLVARFPTGTSLVLMVFGVGVSGIGAYLLRFDFSIQEVIERPVWRLLIPGHNASGKNAASVVAVEAIIGMATSPTP